MLCQFERLIYPQNVSSIDAGSFMQEVARYGVDNVAMLSPYRQKTETGVNALNEMLRELVNPPDEGRLSVG